MADINRVRLGKNEYERLLLKIESLETIATHMTTNLDGMPKGTTRQVDDAWATLADYRSQCVASLHQYLIDCIELNQELDELPYRKGVRFQTRAIMKCKYLDGMTDAQIAEKLHYSDRYVRELLRYGRSLYEKLYGEAAQQ